MNISVEMSIFGIILNHVGAVMSAIVRMGIRFRSSLVKEL